MNKTVSVVIPTYNHAPYVREAIDSALRQTHVPHEIIVVDDESQDETSQILAAYGTQVRSVRQANQGVSAARNLGVSLAQGEFIAFLDSDDIWDPQKLERQLALFEDRPELGLVHCGFTSFDASAASLRPHLEGMEGWITEEMLRLDREVVGPGSTLMIPRRVFDEVGGFDPRLRQGEDWDLCYRIARCYPVGYVRDSLLMYRIHAAGIHLNIPGMENGMILSFEKIFASPDPAIQDIKRRAYGRLHRIIAGSYFAAGRPGQFFRHALRSLRYDPRNLGYFAAYPLRAASRALKR